MAVEKIFLIGMMGAGKSYWAKHIAKWIKSAAYDLDALIEMNEEKSVSEIFEEEGEAHFRKVETKILKWFKEKKKFVLATGGGTPNFNGNIEWMKKEGLVIWLDASLELMLERVLEEKAKRPLIAQLSKEAIKSFMQEKLVERNSAYQQAHYRVSQEQITESYLKKLIQKHAA